MIWEPDNDGIDHINIYSKGKTLLGRKLSNFADSRIKLPEGIFNSIEGYWYYLLIEPGKDLFVAAKREELKDISGWQAKDLGRKLVNIMCVLEGERKFGDREHEEKFKNKIKKALQIKLESDNGLQKLLKESSLPFAHYYVYVGKAVEAGYGWITEYWENLRDG